MIRHLEYNATIKFLTDRGFGLNKTIQMPEELLLNRFEYWAKGDGEDMYLLEVLDRDCVFLFKLV